jgi:hypothetical protein
MGRAKNDWKFHSWILDLLKSNNKNPYTILYDCFLCIIFLLKKNQNELHLYRFSGSLIMNMTSKFSARVSGSGGRGLKLN